MKKALTVLLVAMAVCLVSGNALAAPMTWVDTLNPSGDYKVTTTNPYSGTFNITDSYQTSEYVGMWPLGSWQIVTTPGFVPGVSTITSASVDIDICDDYDLSSEKVTISLDGWNTTTNQTLQWYSNFDVTAGSFSTHLSLLSDGLLALVITATQGDFYFNDATLTVNGDTGSTSPVPEPATLLLLGSGLLGLAGFRRKQK